MNLNERSMIVQKAKRSIDMNNLNEKHLAVFFIQLIIFIVSLVLTWGFFSSESLELLEKRMDEKLGFCSSEAPELNIGEDLFSSICSTFASSEAPELKKALYFFSGEEVTTVTDKTFDLKNRKIWITEKQDAMMGVLFLASMFPSIIFILGGIGNFYQKIREIMLFCMSGIAAVAVMLPFLYPILLLVLLIFIIVWTISWLLMPITFPIGLIIHLGKGIIQVCRFANKNLKK